jgi:hypothetical protein
MDSIFLYAAQGQEEDDRDRFFEDDNFTFPPEGFNLDFQSDRFEIRKVSFTKKKELKISSYVRKFRWERLQVTYEERLPNTVNEEMRKHFSIGLCNRSLLSKFPYI